MKLKKEYFVYWFQWQQWKRMDELKTPDGESYKFSYLTRKAAEESIDKWCKTHKPLICYWRIEETIKNPFYKL